MSQGAYCPHDMTKRNIATFSSDLLISPGQGPSPALRGVLQTTSRKKRSKVPVRLCLAFRQCTCNGSKVRETPKLRPGHEERELMIPDVVGVEKVDCPAVTGYKVMSCSVRYGAIWLHQPCP